MRVHFEKILTGEAQSFACREYRCRSFNAPFHFHPEFELTAILAGTGRRFVADSLEEFGPGDLVLLGPNLPHRWASVSRVGVREMSHSVVLQFCSDCFGEGFWSLPELRKVQALLQRSSRGLCFAPVEAGVITARMQALSGMDDLPRALALLGILHELSLKSARFLASSRYSVDLAAADAERINRVIDFAGENFCDETLGLEQAARVASLTPAAFSRFFARSTGRTFVSFVNEVRLSHVCRLLSESGMPVSEICFACGFGTLSNFYKRFREYKRMTPLEYRRMFAQPQLQVPARFVAMADGTRQ
ncbi:MAG: AraC family transcriptional regulator [Opitutaceae bacterium]|nr:AraC family transcriptional regulator [Opitutaceae bacterium]